MKQKKMLIIAGVVLLILVLGIVFLLQDSEKPGQTDTTDDAERLVAYATEQKNIEKVSYQHKDEEFSIVLSGNTWIFEGEPDLPVSQPRADGIAYDFAEINVTEIVEENATNIEKYGLEPAQTVTTIDLKNGESVSFYVGSRVQGENRYYIKIGNENTVYVADATQCETFLYNKQDLLALNLQTLSANEIQTIRFDRKDNQSFCIERVPDSYAEEWIFTEPFGWGVDESVLSPKLLTFVTSVEAYNYVTDKTEAELGLDDPQVVLETVMIDGTVHSLKVGNIDEESGNVAIKVEGIKYPAVVDLQIIQLTKLTKFDIIDKTVENADYNDIQKVELSGELNLELLYNACQLNDTSISKETAIKLYSDICELKLDGNGTAVSGTPILTISYTYNNKQNKIFKIYKQDAYNYAITLDDNTFFVINRGTYLTWMQQIEAYLVVD